MCGRFVASRPVDEIVEQFGVDEVRLPPELVPGPRFNVAPQDEILAVRSVRLGRSESEGSERERQERRLNAYRWGLIPSWAKDEKVGARAFNARAETLGDKPMFRNALARRRCIVPADAFYEWQDAAAALRTVTPENAGHRSRRPQSRKLPWCFKASDGHMLGFAGLYEVWRQSPDAEWVPSCTIITTRANGLMAPIHDRMPVVLRPEDYELWLAPGALDPGHLRTLLAAPPEDFLTAYRVGFEVSNSRSDGPQLVEPVEESA